MRTALDVQIPFLRTPEYDINKKQLDKEAALRAAQLRRDLRTVFDGAGIPQYSQDPNLSDSPICGSLGGKNPNYKKGLVYLRLGSEALFAS